MNMNIQTKRIMLCRLCDDCGDLYFYCGHYSGRWRTVSFEVARERAAHLLMAIKFTGELRDHISAPAKILRDICEVFSAEEVLTDRGAFDAPTLPSR